MSEDPIGFGGGDTNLCRDVSNSPTRFADPSGLKPRAPRVKGITHIDDYVGKLVRGSERKIRANGFGKTDCGSYGDALEIQVAKDRKAQGGYGGGRITRTIANDLTMGVLVDPKTNTVVEVGAKSGTKNYIQIDMIYSPKGQLQKGDKIDPDTMIGYDIKTSAGGYMKPKQRGRYGEIFNGKNKPRIYRSLYRYDPATNGLQINVETEHDIMVLEMFPDCGAGGPIDSVVRAWSFDAEGPAYEQLKIALSRARNGLHPPLEDPAVIDAYAEYMKAAMGGEYDDYIDLWRGLKYLELQKTPQSSSSLPKGIPLGN